jgi:hypothetical protein
MKEAMKMTRIAQEHYSNRLSGKKKMEKLFIWDPVLMTHCSFIDNYNYAEDSSHKKKERERERELGLVYTGITLHTDEC